MSRACDSRVDQQEERVAKHRQQHDTVRSSQKSNDLRMDVHECKGYLS